MAFELEFELAGNFIKGLIKDTQGNKEESKAKIASDVLTNLIMSIDEGAKKFGFSAQDLLKRTKSVKLHVPDIVTDTVKNKKGARIGLIVSEGYGKNIYFEGNGENPIFGSIVAKDMAVGIEEEVSDGGEIILKPGEEEVKDKVRYLMEYGSGIIAVSFKNADLDPANERLVKEIIESDYPRHYLGAVPVLVSYDFCQERDSFIRTNVCLLNAYAWFNLDHFLRRVEAFLNQNGYNYNLLVAQADEEAVNIHRVTPLKTCASDQIAFIKAMYR